VRRIAQNVESKMRNFPGHKSGRAVTLSRLLVRWDEQVIRTYIRTKNWPVGKWSSLS